MLKKQNKELEFMFDTVFTLDANNEDIFEGTTKELINNLLDGYNCSVFAYGATGAGKTHTMLGKEDDPGITYRTVAELFSKMDEQSEERDFSLGVTYLEVYNENVQDLLHKSGPLHIRDDGRCGMIVAGMKIITIHSADELLTLLARGNRNRTQHPTDANQESSRSHAVFQVYVMITNKLDGQVRKVKLSMIDLAGSERATATGMNSARFKEGANINKSLLALGNCINNLADGIKHINYRDSKLTRLLKDSLGGNCHTVMIANISPSSKSFEDTYNTLRYANRAKKIKTSVKKNIVNCQMHVTGYIKMVEDQKKEIQQLKQKLQALEGKPVKVVQDPKVTAEKEKLTAELEDKLVKLHDRRRMLHEKILSLESSDKILCCRIKYKRCADERLQHLTAAIDIEVCEEQNTSGKSRVNKSVLYFMRQRESVKSQITASWQELKVVERETEDLHNKIKHSGLEKQFADKLAMCDMELDKVKSQQSFEHVRKVTSLQQCEMQSVYSMVRMLSKTLQTHSNMIRGFGMMTDPMKHELKHLVKSLEGAKNIRWADSTEDQEEDFYGLTCLSTDLLNDPLNNEFPIYQDLQEEGNAHGLENGAGDEHANSMVDMALPTTTEIHNTTVTLEDSDGEGLLKGESILNNTFNLNDKKPKKRTHPEQQHLTNGSATPPKLVKNLVKQSSGPLETDKENKHVKPATITSKQLAILQKIKSADKAKPTDASSQSLKCVREKERRALIGSHPYPKSKPK